MKSIQNIEDKDWEIIAKSLFDGNPETGAEIQNSALEEMIPEEKERVQLNRIIRQVDTYFGLKKFTADAAWKNIESRIHPTSVPNQTRTRKLMTSPFFRMAAAAVFAAVLLISGYGLFYNRIEAGKMMEITSAGEVLNTFTLPDGTLVSLNSDTRLKYPKHFGKNTREVSIEGEAFFEVKPNKNKPFIIHAGKAQVKVLGTSFNVSAYPETKMVEVIVATGEVQVMNKTDQTIQTNELILNPGDKGTLVYSSNSLLKTTNQDPNFLSWKTHKLIFKATSLDEVVRNLEKVYKVNISLADTKLNGLLLTAQFNDYPLDFILQVIETTFNIETQKVNGHYILKART
ncbi:MAG: FecR domain-containing protein [Prolixibacteraceae bacterium]